MPVDQRRASLSGANLMIFSGKVTRDELLAQFGDIDESDSASSNNWLVVDMGYADISELSFAVLAQLKAVLAVKMAVMKARRPFDVAIVCQRPLNAPIYLTWQSFVDQDKDYPSRPLFFSDLRSACRHLGYEGSEYAEIFDLCMETR